MVTDENGRSARMQIVVTKGQSRDEIRVSRADGTQDVTAFPKKGPIPHDLVHLIVESEFGLSKGFWGHVADGVSLAAVGQLAKAGGHASSKRAQAPSPDILQLVQAERLVECFEADLWGEPTDRETFCGVLAAACAQSCVPAPAVDEVRLASVRARLGALRQTWTALQIGQDFAAVWELA